MSNPVFRGVLLFLALSLFAMPSGAQEPPRWEFSPSDTLQGADGTYGLVSTFLVEVGKSHRICAGNPHTTNGFDLEVRRYRVEGGSYENMSRLNISEMEESAPDTNVWCQDTLPIPRAGHWVYEARWCFEGTDTCSIYATALLPGDENFQTPAAGYVDPLGPKGWWIYSYLGTPDPVLD